eukprot:TRINITY_DN27555_c0_g1_i1.p1 TRINITY_DN27555_c0_g1~~TRINITY_DN27555_c0_g1_i1.p1  ORF type:complete len:487 (+),score=123.94 TRINITY_DN27555_c0_g1_i1:137-1597(+)
MYVGAWQEYNLHKVMELYKANEQASKDGSTKAGSRRRLGSTHSNGGDSAATAPYRRRPLDASSLASSSRSAYTDVDDYRKQRRDLQRGLAGGRGGGGGAYGGRGGGKASTRPRPGGKKAARAGSGRGRKQDEDDETQERKRRIEQMARLYRGELPETPEDGPAPNLATAPGDATCPHCSTPYERFCSKTGQPHQLSGTASATPQQTAVPPGRPAPPPQAAPSAEPASAPALGTSVIAQLMRARDSTTARAPPEAPTQHAPPSGVVPPYYQGFHHRVDADVPAPSSVLGAGGTTSPLSQASVPMGARRVVEVEERRYRVEQTLPYPTGGGVHPYSSAPPARIHVSPPPVHAQAAAPRQHSPLYNRASDAAKAPFPLSDAASHVSPPPHQAGKVSSAVTHGNILSPCGTPTGISPSQAPIRRPAQRTHVDDDELILRMSQTLRSVPDSTGRPISSPGLPSASEVEALLQWTDNLGVPGTPVWPHQGGL